MRTVILTAITLLTALLIVLVVRSMPNNTTTQTGEPYPYQPNAQYLAQTMSEAVQIKTISHSRDAPPPAKELLAFHKLLEQKYPLVHQHLTREIINQYSLLYHWKGSNPTNLKPAILLGHIDVVPISPGTEKQWKQPPFSGAIVDDVVWGRGTVDVKINIIASLQAAEDMLASGLSPNRDVYLAFGHDEEIGGIEGAGQIARTLEARGVSCEFVLDEGGWIISGALPGITKPIALVAPAEKGIVTLRLTATGLGGHSSAPPPQSAIGILSAAIAALEAEPFPRDTSHMRALLEAVSDHMSWGQRFFVKNMWLFEPLVLARFEGNRTMQATMRTTTAATVIAGGVKSNVLPIDATALVNFRILPGDTVGGVKARVERVIDDARVVVAFEGSWGGEPSPVASITGASWERLSAAIRDSVAPEEVIIAPQLLIAATDTRHYRRLCVDHYRYNGARFGLDTIGMIHGTNERISVDNIREVTRFYHRLMNGL